MAECVTSPLPKSLKLSGSTVPNATSSKIDSCRAIQVDLTKKQIEELKDHLRNFKDTGNALVNNAKIKQSTGGHIQMIRKSSKENVPHLNQRQTLDKNGDNHKKESFNVGDGLLKLKYTNDDLKKCCAELLKHSNQEKSDHSEKEQQLKVSSEDAERKNEIRKTCRNCTEKEKNDNDDANKNLNSCREAKSSYICEYDKLKIIKNEDNKTEQNDVFNVPHVLVDGKSNGTFDWRETCGCLKTSDKLKELLKRFPTAPPPPPPPSSPICNIRRFENSTFDSACCPGGWRMMPTSSVSKIDDNQKEKPASVRRAISTHIWSFIREMVNLLQVWLTATAMVIYYILYFYMQMVYYMLVSALFFHNADGAMKVTIAVVTITSIIVGFNLMIRMEKLVGITVNE